MFWQEAKNLAYTGEVDTKLPPREFPSTDMVHYFHPIAFIRQMLLINEGYAPWVEYLFEEYETHKGIKENKSPLKERISEYHNSSTARGRTYSTAWCASFVSWCFEQAGYKKVNSGSNSFAFDWAPEGNDLAKKKSESLSTPDPNLTGWSEGEKCEPFVGAVIVLTYSHCAIIIGKNSRLNRYVYIGGNQGKGIQEIKYGTVTIGNEYAIMKPKKYNVQSYELPELNKNENGSYATTH